MKILATSTAPFDFDPPAGVEVVSFDPREPVPAEHLDADAAIVEGGGGAGITHLAREASNLTWVQTLAAGPDGVLTAGFLTQPPSGLPIGREGGVGPAILGSLLLGGTACLFGSILGLSVAMRLAFGRPPDFEAAVLRMSVRITAGIPSCTTLSSVPQATGRRVTVTCISPGRLGSSKVSV